MKKLSAVRGLIVMLTVGICLCLSPFLLYAEVKPGDVIDASNWQKAVDVLTPVTLELVKTHGLIIHVAEDKEYPLNAKYIEATKKYEGTVKLENNLADYNAGCPFPDIDPKAPDAGLKVAWNYQYHCQCEQRFFPWATFNWVNKSGKIERKATLHSSVYFFTGRTVNDPKPQVPGSEDIIMKELFKLYDPKDIAGVGFLSIRYKDEDKDDDIWAYVPALRRARRMSSAMRTDAYIGTDLAIEDFYGFYGKVSEFDWKVIDKKKILAIRDSEREPAGMGGGKYKWCPPEDLPWRLRDVWVVESIPKVKGHPYGKRILYIDAQWYDCLFSEIYDRNMDFWKIWIQPWFYRAKWQWFTYSGCWMIDLQAMHATVVTNECTPNGDYGPELFTLQNLEKTGH